jgi:hypothetical protein
MKLQQKYLFFYLSILYLSESKLENLDIKCFAFEIKRSTFLLAKYIMQCCLMFVYAVEMLSFLSGKICGRKQVIRIVIDTRIIKSMKPTGYCLISAV